MADDIEEYSVSLPSEFVEDDLLPEYPAASRPSEAIRMAVQESVQRRQQMIAPGRIRDDVIKAIERAGKGSVENCQRVIIGDKEQLAVTDTDSVEIDEED